MTGGGTSPALRILQNCVLVTPSFCIMSLILRNSFTSFGLSLLFSFVILQSNYQLGFANTAHTMLMFNINYREIADDLALNTR